MHRRHLSGTPLLQPTKRNIPFVVESAVEPDLGSKLGRSGPPTPDLPLPPRLLRGVWGPHVGASSAFELLPDNCRRPRDSGSSECNLSHQAALSARPHGFCTFETLTDGRQVNSTA